MATARQILLAGFASAACRLGCLSPLPKTSQRAKNHRIFRSLGHTQRGHGTREQSSGLLDSRARQINGKGRVPPPALPAVGRSVCGSRRWRRVRGDRRRPGAPLPHRVGRDRRGIRASPSKAASRPVDCGVRSDRAVSARGRPARTARNYWCLSGTPAVRLAHLSSFGKRNKAPYNASMTDGDMNFVSLLLLGLFLGMRHATDADHIVAIATIVSRQRTMRGSLLIGAAWGIGHTVTVMAVGSAIILFGLVIPPWLGLSMEFAVGLMLVLLGVVTLSGLGRSGWHNHVHSHGDYVHQHPHGHEPEDHGHADEQTPLAALDRSWLGGLLLYQWLRPFAVGLVHGLAGSAAIALLVVTIIREPILAVAYLFLFGVGTIGGMMLITLLLVAPFAFTARNLPRFNWQLGVASGLISFAFGLFLVYDIGFADGGLFSDHPNWQPR